MKKYLLIVIAAVSLSFNGYSQCTPDASILRPGIYPDSATNLPHAYVGVPYSTVLQVKVPKDTNTTYLGFPVTVTVDTITLVSMTGFPPGGYTYQCNPNPTCFWLTSANGCVLITGPAPNASQIGMKYYLTAIIKTSVHVTNPPLGTKITQTDTLRYYYIQVDDNSGVGMLSSSKFSVTQNHPNPFNKSTFIEFYSPTGGTVSLTVSNMLGKTVSSKTMKIQQGNNKITLSAKEFDPGIYFYTLTTDKQSVTKRMVVDNE